MDEKTALHTAARRYCQARFSEWVQVYEELQLKENWRVEKLFQPGWTYSDEAYKTFPSTKSILAFLSLVIEMVANNIPLPSRWTG